MLDNGNADEIKINLVEPIDYNILHYRKILKVKELLFYINSILNFLELGTAGVQALKLALPNFIIAFLPIVWAVILPIVWAVIAFWNELLPLLCHIHLLRNQKNEIPAWKLILFSIIPALIRLLLISAFLVNLACPFGLNLFFGANTFQYLLLIIVLCDLLRSSNLFLQECPKEPDKIYMFARNIFLLISILFLIFLPGKIGLISSAVLFISALLLNYLARYEFKKAENVNFADFEALDDNNYYSTLDRTRDHFLWQLSAGMDGETTFVEHPPNPPPNQSPNR